MKKFLHVIFACLYVLATFYGLGPVLMADGSLQERILTAAIVFLIYAILIIVHRFILRKIH